MKKSIIVLILLLGISAVNCRKKNYPKDIPKWLKEKIEKMDKEARKIPILGRFDEKYSRECKSYYYCRNVSEHTDGSSTFYHLQTGINPSHYYVYNYPGDLICEYDGADLSPCFLKYDRLTQVRVVWRE